jgi:DNA-binding response OmpR family regulator
VEVYVSRLRAKLGDAAVIRAVRGMGYRIDESPAK